MDPYPELWMRKVMRRLAAAKARCRNPNNPRWGDYGGRGITFDFLNLRDATEWVIQHLGEPAPKLELDRINNDKGYGPGNLRWATRSEQNANRRRKSTTS